MSGPWNDLGKGLRIPVVIWTLCALLCVGVHGWFAAALFAGLAGMALLVQYEWGRR